MADKTKENHVMIESEKIKEFIDFIRDCQEKYNINNSIMQEADKETQDILHKLELEKLTYHLHAKVNKELSEIRKERRKAKDAVTVLEPIVNYLKQNKSVIDALSQLLGNVRKEERKQENRFYIPKSEKYKDIFDTEV